MSRKYEDIGARFMRYAAIGTQSEEGHTQTPSTPEQHVLAALLTEELREMGASDVFYDRENCYVYAEIPGNMPEMSGEARAALSERPDTVTKRRTNTAPIIGLMAHMDTSDAVKGKQVTPRRISAYDGGDILLREGTGSEAPIVLSPKAYPSLSHQIGSDLVVTDGTSVLGGDDKAGIAAIMETAEFLLTHPEYAHGTVRICFTPDEEVGNGTAYLDLTRFACDFAYTVDGGEVGELEYENFNAASADIRIQGISTHPGDAKDKMRNALLLAMELNSKLPPMEIPACTSGYEGFFHLMEVTGTEDATEMHYIIRDHDRTRFEERKETMRKAVAAMNKKWRKAEEAADPIRLTLKDSYFNMKEKVAPHMHLIENAVTAMQAEGVEPKISPIRGGTDGCQISFRGIPCPNLGTGAYNYHSRFEYVSVQEMAVNVRILVRILNRYASFVLNVPEVIGENQTKRDAEQKAVLSDSETEGQSFDTGASEREEHHG